MFWALFIITSFGMERIGSADTLAQCIEDGQMTEKYQVKNGVLTGPKPVNFICAPNRWTYSDSGGSE
ncbi:MAG: hypothetical protein ACPG4X_16975 [Pikeienuella sp.]